MRTTARWLLSFALVGALASVARADEAEDELLSTVYTENGYELRRDERLFALYAAFNMAGLDRADESRPQPFARRSFHPIRVSLRDALAPSGEKLRGPVESYLDAHPAPFETYVAGALLLGEEPDFRPLKPLPSGVSGLDRMLSEFVRASKLSKLGRQLATDYRAEFKKLRALVDEPFAKMRASFKLKEETAPSLVLVPMPLDASGRPFAMRDADGAHVVVFGIPAEGALDMAPVLEAYSKLLSSETHSREGAKAESVSR